MVIWSKSEHFVQVSSSESVVVKAVDFNKYAT